MSVILTTIQLVVGAVLTSAIYRRYLHPLSRYPGPFLASFTNLWKFFTYFGGEHHLIEQKLHEKYGYVVRVGPNSLSFSSLADFNAIYGFNKAIEKGDFYDFGREGRTRGENIFSARTDATHRELRKKVVGPAFSGAKIASYEPIISKHVKEFLKRTADPRKRSSRVNVAPIVQYLTSDTMIEILFGDGMCRHPYSNQEASRDVHAAMRNLSKYAWGGSLLPWFGWLMNTAPMQYLMRRPAFDANGNIIGLAALVILSKKLIEENPEKALDSSQPSIVKNYLEVPKNDSRHMSSGQIWGECFNLTLAGPGSTAAAITSILYQLGTPEGFQWQKRIQHEARAKQEVPASAIALLTAVIKETLRLNAPFPTAFPREIMAGAENSIPSATAPLPVGTVVSASTFILGRSKEIWGEDAELWKPERWLVDEEELRELDEKFVAFSKGARGCIGKDLAMLLITKTLIGVLREFEITDSGRLVGKSFLEMQYEVCEVRLSRCKERWNFFSK